MGRDKALLPLRGRALGQYIADAVATAAGRVVLIGDPERYGPLGYPVIPDRYPGEGPLGGILTALNGTDCDPVTAGNQDCFVATVLADTLSGKLGCPRNCVRYPRAVVP